MKRLFLSVLMALAIVPAAFSAANSGNCGPVVNGAFSNTCTWKIDTIHHFQYGYLCQRLTISGTGSTADFDFSNPWPWWEDSQTIKIVEVESGVTRIGNFAFWNLTDVRSISLAGTVTTLGDYVYYGCSALQTVYLPTSLRTIGIAPFYDCTSLATINAINSTYFYSDNGVLYTYDKKELICFPAASSITDYTVLSETKTLRQFAFDGGTNLRILRLHKNITDYQDKCLNATPVTDLYAPFLPVTTVNSNTFNLNKGNIRLHVPSNLAEEYRNADIWKQFNIVADLLPDYTDLIYIDGVRCIPDGGLGTVSSPKITSGTVTYKNKKLTLNNATVEAPIKADVALLEVNGECTVSAPGNDHVLHLVNTQENSTTVIYGFSENTHLHIVLQEPTLASLKNAALYTEASKLHILNYSVSDPYVDITLGVTIDTRRIGMDAPADCEVRLNQQLRFLRIRPEDSAAFDAYCYTDNISFFLSGTPSLNGDALSEETDDANGNCLWEQPNAQGLEDVQRDNIPCTKLLRNGMLIIRTGGKEYNAQGIEL